MKLNVYIRQGEKSDKLRKEGNIPAIMYGKHLKAPVSLVCKKNEFIKKFKESGYSTPITVEGKGVEEMVLIHDLQRDPVTDIVLHVDFLAVRKDQKVITEIPVILVGESSVEKLGEGKVQLVKAFIEVEAFPQDLLHDIKIDITHIEKVHDTIFVKDLKISDKIRVLDDPEEAVVTVVSLVEEVEEVVAPVVDAAATPAAGTTPAAGAPGTQTPTQPAKK